MEPTLPNPRGLPARTARSSPDRISSRGRSLDRISLGGLALGLVLMLQPWWSGGFRLGFFLLLAATVLQIVAGHLAPDPAEDAHGGGDPG